MSDQRRNTASREIPYDEHDAAARDGGFEKHLKSWYGILGILGAMLLTGWSASGFLAGKADATSVATDHSKIEKLDVEQQTLQVEYTHLHEDVRGLREDVRAGFSGRALPALTPEPPLVIPSPPSPTLTPMVTHP